MRTGDDIQSTITTVSTCYLCYFVAESGGAGVSGVCACLHVRVSPKTTACQMSVGVCACVRVFVSIMLTTYSFSHAHTRTRARAARVHTQEFCRCSRLAFLLRGTDTQRFTRSRPHTCCTGYVCVYVHMYADSICI